jgi:HPt (histidine-containing phosphotransfer) domain-containing protein
MSEDESKFLVRLQGTFSREVLAIAATMRALLQEIQATQAAGDCAPLLHQLAHTVHSLKGAAGAIDQHELAYLSRSLEQVLAGLQCDSRQIPDAFFTLFRQSIALIERMARTDDTGNAIVIPHSLVEEIHRFADAR